MLNGKELRGGTIVDTVNGLGKVNGRQEYATAEQVQALKDHITMYQPPVIDLRGPIRRIEQRLLSPDTANGGYCGELIGNQCIDFQKQDGVTEMEEATMANAVERKLNDLLLRDEQDDGKILVNRRPIYISCVSNFTNFLDLFRKTIRSLEVGIPCIVLGRSNTSQHGYRWTKLLMELCIEEGIDPGMITFLSCPLEDIKDITQSCQSHTGNLYSTCSRELAASIKAGYPNTVTSTGGPNTLIAMDWTKPVQEAVRMSATIESSGQCTALRHIVGPTNLSNDDVATMFQDSVAIDSAPDAMKASAFDGIFPNHNGSAPGPVTDDDGNSKNGYIHHDNVDASYRLSDDLPPNDIQEHWRRVVVDVSKLDIAQRIDDVASWLNTNQPISLAVNGKTREEALDVGLSLWERTGLVVNTIGGSTNQPALTCQARPQEGEIFGEFPPRHSLQTYTKYPVVVPSSTPGYDSTYTTKFLLQQQKTKSVSSIVSTDATAATTTIENVELFFDSISNDHIKGYCITLLEYLIDATKENPKRGFGTSRTAVWGLQRLPLNTVTYLRCDTSAISWDDLAPYLLVFFVTNAKDQVVVLLPTSSSENQKECATKITELCNKLGITIRLDDDMKEEDLSPGDNLKDIVKLSTLDNDDNDKNNIENPDSNTATTADWPIMVGQFLTTLLPVGHIKSTVPNDEEFITRVSSMSKWLKITH